MAKRPEKLPPQPIPDEFPVHNTVPMIHERLLGRLVVEWAKMEQAMDDLIWQFLDLPNEFGRILTSRMDASSKSQMIRQLSQLSFGHSTSDYMVWSYIDDLLKRLEILKEARNLAVHGTWARNHPDLTPMAFSLRIKDTPSTIVAEHFSERRMRDLIEESLRLKASLASLFDAATAAHHRSRERFHRETQSHLANPLDQTTLTGPKLTRAIT